MPLHDVGGGILADAEVAGDPSVAEQPWFLESAQWELPGLHEHNCVLHGLAPADIDAWKTVWDA